MREFRKGPRAVDGIDLRVEPGEIYGFLGPNGAGKSTTVLMLTTLLPPTAGTARVAGFDVVKEGPKVRAVDRRGAAGGRARPAPHRPRPPAAPDDAPGAAARAERRPRTEELLERVGLTEAADRKVGGYSGGMKRRLDLALALVHRPRVLFLDEPTTGLDPQSRTALWEEVARLAREDGVTVFLTTQYLEEADVLADRVGIIDHGRIVAEGTPADSRPRSVGPSVHAIPAREQDERRDRRAPRPVRRAARDDGELAVRLDDGRRPRRRRPRARPGGHRARRRRAAGADPRRRLPREDRPHARGRRRRRRGAGAVGRDAASSPSRSGRVAGRSIKRTLRQPAMSSRRSSSPSR